MPIAMNTKKTRFLSIFPALLLLTCITTNLYADGSDTIKKLHWHGSFSAGYNRSSGNTRNNQMNGSLSAGISEAYKYEFSIKGETFYSSADGEMDGQKHAGSTRYMFGLGRGEKKKWYNFYKLEAGHDRFANIDYRLVPGVGIGYWLFDRPLIKAMFEIAAGFEHTEYRDSTESDNETILIPRAYFEKTFGKGAIFSEDIVYYPATEDFGRYRIHSETSLKSPLTKDFSLKIAFIDDYNSSPPTGIKKNDTRLMTTITFAF